MNMKRAYVLFLKTSYVITGFPQISVFDFNSNKKTYVMNKYDSHALDLMQTRE